MTTVVNVRKEGYDIYIGRGSKYGNPFVIGKDGDRAEVIQKYRAYLNEHPELIAAAKRELRNKRLGCFCWPLACHGQILAEVVNGTM